MNVCTPSAEPKTAFSSAGEPGLIEELLRGAGSSERFHEGR